MHTMYMCVNTYTCVCVYIYIYASVHIPEENSRLPPNPNLLLPVSTTLPLSGGQGKSSLHRPRAPPHVWAA